MCVLFLYIFINYRRAPHRDNKTELDGAFKWDKALELHHIFYVIDLSWIRALILYIPPVFSFCVVFVAFSGGPVLETPDLCHCRGSLRSADPAVNGFSGRSQEHAVQDFGQGFFRRGKSSRGTLNVTARFFCAFFFFFDTTMVVAMQSVKMVSDFSL